MQFLLNFWQIEYCMEWTVDPLKGISNLIIHVFTNFSISAAAACIDMENLENVDSEKN